MKEEFIKAVQDFAVSIDPSTRVYVGADSRKKKRVDGTYVINFTTCAVFHLNGKNGAKVFASVDKERDYSGSLRLRLMTEVYKAIELYGALATVIDPDRIEVHLDLNSSPKYKSNVVVKEAVGYVMGMTQKNPVIKPDAWAASTCADLWEFKSFND